LLEQIFEAKARFIDSIFSLFKPRKSSSHHNSGHHNYPRIENNAIVADDIDELSHVPFSVEQYLHEGQINKVVADAGPVRGHSFDAVDPASQHLLKSKGALETLVACGSSTDAEAFTIVSPSYPNDYPNGADCSWRVAAAPGACSLSLHFVDFIVEESSGCVDDWLSLSSVSARVCGQRSGQHVRLPLEAGADSWTLTFRSDGRGTCRGFKIEAIQEPCSFKGNYTH
jgi:hypothetical protein